MMISFPVNSPFSEVEYKLTGTNNQDIGAVSIKYADTWGRVCPNDWDDNAAKVSLHYVYTPNTDPLLNINGGLT